MNNNNTKLVNALLKGEDISEIFRAEVEKAINTVLEAELTGFLNYEKHSVEGYNTGNSRNGSYSKTIYSEYGKLSIKVPRDRNSEFTPQTLVPYKRNTQNLEETIILLYKRGMTTREIGKIVEQLYGHYYSPQTISVITKQLDEKVKEYHSRKITKEYAVVYADSTYISVKRGTVGKEALHILIGITISGEKEILSYELFPTESPENYKDMLEDLKKRGLNKVLLFVTDGLKGIKEKLEEVFPKAKYQTCWTHVIRNVLLKVRSKDKTEISEDLKAVYQASTKDEAEKNLALFIDKYKGKYPKVTNSLLDIRDCLFTYYLFPKPIRRSIYTTNIIENYNKHLKKGIKKKEQFPNEQSLNRYVCVSACEYNVKYVGISHYGFSMAKEELENMIEEIYIN